VSTQAEAYQHKIRQLEGELTELRQHLSRVCRDLRDQKAINRHLQKDVDKLERVKQVMRA
jgi:hypothetical protein